MGLYVPSHWPTDLPMEPKLLANGWGHATGLLTRPYVPSYWLANGAICAKLLADKKGSYAPSYWLMDWAICAKLQANG